MTRDELPPPDAAPALETDPATLTALLWHGGSVDEALDSGKLQLLGSRTELDAFLELFAA